ncbi:MAG: nucleoside triphosphate pyrophosphohydrolase [Steroidobacteraceae bacterium]
MSDLSPIERLLEVMRRLRDPDGGCPWDREQSFESIAPYTIEEAYEVADAIDRRDYAALRKELGDLLFQVVFHSQLAEERGFFGFNDVANAISDKLTARHPNVFAGEHIASAAEQNQAWERHKAAERAAHGLGTLDDVPLPLPALKRAEKLGQRASAEGFDWPNVAGPRAALDGELAELDGALEQGVAHDALLEELGDILFSVANIARHLNIDPEEALRLGNRKFAARYREVERAMAARGRKISDGSPDELDALWRIAKETLRKQ